MILLTVDEIIDIHKTLIRKTGGSHGLRDIGLLESVVYSAESSFAGIEQYPTIEQKAARLAYSLTKNRSFVDGNKRIGVLVMLATLRLNGIMLEYTQKELIEVGLCIADGSFVYEDILDFINEHKNDYDKNS